MSLKFHHLDIYRNIYIFDKQMIISPYLCDEYDNPYFINKIKDKVFSGNETSLAYSTDLILNDKSLINDLAEQDCYMLFSLADNEYLQSYPLYDIEQWDKRINIDDLFFLGYDIFNKADGAIIDGIYPVIIENKKIISLELSDFNKYGLLDYDKAVKYLERNKNEVKIYVNGYEIKTNWKAVAIYCDQYTLKKLDVLYDKIQNK